VTPFWCQGKNCGRPQRGLGGHELCHRGLGAAGAAGVLQVRGAVGEQARRIEARRHVGEHELDRLQLGERAPERRAPLRAGERILERGAANAEVPGGDGDAPVEQAERLLEALVLLADQVPSPAIDARLLNRLTESNARLLQRRRPGAQDCRSHRTVCDGAMTPRRLHYAMSQRGTPFFP